MGDLPVRPRSPGPFVGIGPRSRRLGADVQPGREQRRHHATAAGAARRRRVIDPPTSQSVYFGNRGSQFFPGYAVFDTSFNYDIPLVKTLRPWVKLDIYNLFNNQKLIGYITTVRADPNGPVDSLGLPLDYVKSGSFGQARSAADYPQPFQGATGGRTFRVAFGLRW